ncbi:FAD-dependent oxidoreductase [Chondromyces apiculatus]|uniref:Amine oxidase domain-containing protein n=1 Tax=Chondromyces apiculatus DSM 436 TaxID=1192034 RepID=A0A017TIH9_9BACT|nr:FAD-dependent oxidoreductase [Chondromyces apiculatus]EYF08707.1 Hypothetical protein CAP_2568 [Chondromyces apiculatus DSM 436]
MTKVLIMGGGLAGLAAGWTLLECSNGALEVTLLERGHLLGGKASSKALREGDRSYEIEHGLHAFFDYPNFRRLLGDAAPEALTRIKKNTSGAAFPDGRGLSWLRPVNLPSPLHLIGGRKAASKANPFRLARLALAGIMLRPECLSPSERRRLDETKYDAFVERLGFSKLDLADPLFTMGERATFAFPYPASALAMLHALRLTQQRCESQQVGHLDGPIGEVLITPLARAFKERGGKILPFSPVSGLEHEGGRVTGVRVGPRPAWPHGAEAKQRPEVPIRLSPYHSPDPAPGPGAGSRVEADVYISALPPRALDKVLDEGLRSTPFFAALGKLITQRTIACQIYYDRIVTPPSVEGMVIGLPGRFSALLDRARVWKAPDGPGSVLELVGEEKPGDFSDPQQIEEAVQEAEKYIQEMFPEALPERVQRRWFHCTNHDEYFVTATGSDAQRPPAVTPLGNFLLAGDYTAHSFGVVGMEGAVVSGIEAANAALRRLGLPQREVRPMSEPGGFIPALRALLKMTGLFRFMVGYDEMIGC